MLTGKLSCLKPLIVTQPSFETIAVNPTVSIKFFESSFASEIRLIFTTKRITVRTTSQIYQPSTH